MAYDHSRAMMSRPLAVGGRSSRTGLTSTSTVRRFSQISSGGGWYRGGCPAASSSFLTRSAVFVRARWSLSSSRSSVSTS